ncbi:MAG: PadR family transcriptional regulator [Bacteroidota bacterium]
MSTRENLGEFEELVLLVVGVLYDEAYGVAIQKQIAEQTGRSINISAVHSALHRLEEKSFLESRMGGATTERGGRRKRYFRVTTAGQRALANVREMRNQLWNQISPVAFDLKQG